MTSKKIALFTASALVATTIMISEGKNSAPNNDSQNQVQSIQIQVEKQVKELAQKPFNRLKKNDLVESFEEKFIRFNQLEDYIIQDLVQDTAQAIDQKNMMMALKGQNKDSSGREKLIDLHRTYDALQKVQLLRMVNQQI